MAAAPGNPAMAATFGGPGAIFFAGIQQHDDEDEEHHDGAGVDDDLGGGEELGAEGEVKDGERHHDDNQRKRGVDGVLLQQQIERGADREQTEEDEEKKFHRCVDRSLVQSRGGESGDCQVRVHCKAFARGCRFGATEESRILRGATE